MTITSAPERLSVEQAASYLGVSASTLNKLRLGDSGPVFHKLGRRVAYSRTDLDAFLNASRRRSTSDRGESATAA
jgi:excisionase family DNA binding protein